MRSACLLMIFLASAVSAADPGPSPLLRFPDIHGDRVVFTYGGDLWTASTSGGTAVRLTSHPGLELFGKFSPDGRSIAFTGQYGGDEQLYVMPAAGGVARQLTFYPASGPRADRWGYDNQSRPPNRVAWSSFWNKKMTSGLFPLTVTRPMQAKSAPCSKA